MGALHSIRNLLLYGGLSKEEFHTVSDDVTAENLRCLKLYAPIACVVFCVLALLSCVTPGIPSNNTWIYCGSCLAMGLLALAVHLFADQRPWLGSLCLHLFIIVLYAFSIAVAVIHVQYPSVSAIVFLMVAPLIFIDRPLNVSVEIIAQIVVLSLMTLAIKDPQVASDDIWNAVTFGAVGMVTNAFLMRTKFRSLYQAHEIAYLSETDVLTGLKNRNCYENRLEDYPRKYAGNLVCAYADADGLHALNNERGHDAGDRLLCAIAHAMQDLYGEKHTYRIGGDEFVAFIPKGSLTKVQEQLAHMKTKLEAQGHRVSCGAAQTDAAYADMRGLVREAEKRMYEQKRMTGITRE